MRHDWVYRWEAVLKAVGLEPTVELLQRKERLSRLAEAVKGYDSRTGDAPKNGALGEAPVRHGGV